MTEKNNLLFEHSPWWILICIAVGLLYAFLLYQRKSTWSASIGRVLFGLRFALVTLMAILLLSPFLRLVLSEVEKPFFVIALDNSTSMTGKSDSATMAELQTNLDGLSKLLSSKAIRIEKRDLANRKLEKFIGLTFDQQITDLSSLLRSWQTEFESRPFCGALLVSDGIYNSGMSPQYVSFPTKVYTLGIGDTIPAKDLILNPIIYNKVAYQGNLFPVRAEVANQGIEAGSVTLAVKKNGETIVSQQLTPQADNQLIINDFQVLAKEKGLQHYVVELSRHPKEASIANNRQDIYIDIVEGKEKILIASGAPHPDMKSLKTSLAKNENYEITTYIPSINNKLPTGKYDLVILLSPFEREHRLSELLERIKKENINSWMILGENTLWEEVNAQNLLFKIKRNRNEVDQVRPAFNDAFRIFTYENDWKGIVNSDYTPVTVPYGEYELQGGVAVALYQKVGAIITPRPLWFLSQNRQPRQAITLGEGLWQWRMQEFSRTGNSTTAFDNLVLKTVQYLSTSEDRQKFRVYTSKIEFVDSEQVVFQSEAYNDVFELTFGQETELRLTNTEGSVSTYSYTTAPGNSRFQLGGLKEGIYKFEATAIIGGKKEVSSGRFTVRKLDLENLKLTADFNTLRELSQSTGATFFQTNQWEEMSRTLEAIDAKGKIHSSEHYFPIIRLWWIFALLMALLSAEWFIRKYSGGY